MIRSILDFPGRPPDPKGEGHFGASRGSRKHKGQDKAVPAGYPVKADITGVVDYSKAYQSSPEYDIVSITSKKNPDYRIRYFYVSPIKRLPQGTVVNKGDIIGRVQSIHKKYDGDTVTVKDDITNHIHVEWHINGVPKNPKLLEKRYIDFF